MKKATTSSATRVEGEAALFERSAARAARRPDPCDLLPGLVPQAGADVSPPERLPGMGACSPLAATEGVPKRHVCKPGVHDWLRQAN